MHWLVAVDGAVGEAEVAEVVAPAVAADFMVEAEVVIAEAAEVDVVPVRRDVRRRCLVLVAVTAVAVDRVEAWLVHDLGRVVPVLAADRCNDRKATDLRSATCQRRIAQAAESVSGRGVVARVHDREQAARDRGRALLAVVVDPVVVGRRKVR